jgi:hypothetical protein
MIDLSNVTLVSIDSVEDHYSKSNIRLAAISRIIPELTKEIKFGDILMINPFGKSKNLLDYDFNPIWKDYRGAGAPKNINWYSNYVVKKLPFLIKTEWYLIIQWDGFPINPHKWSNEFFEYPFLGGGHSVYNGGFSLRHTETMCKMAQTDETFGSGAEDGFYSAFLDNEWMADRETPFKIKWADENVVNKFCHWNSEDKIDNAFGWHRMCFLSKKDIEKAFLHYRNEFNSEEIKKLINYCLIKEIDFDLIESNVNKIELFDIEYNQYFFDNY